MAIRGAVPGPSTEPVEPAAAAGWKLTRLAPRTTVAAMIGSIRSDDSRTAMERRIDVERGCLAGRATGGARWANTARRMPRPRNAPIGRRRKRLAGVDRSLLAWWSRAIARATPAGAFSNMVSCGTDPVRSGRRVGAWSVLGRDVVSWVSCFAADAHSSAGTDSAGPYHGVKARRKRPLVTGLRAEGP